MNCLNFAAFTRLAEFSAVASGEVPPRGVREAREDVGVRTGAVPIPVKCSARSERPRPQLRLDGVERVRRVAHSEKSFFGDSFARLSKSRTSSMVNACAPRCRTAWQFGHTGRRSAIGS